MEFLEVAKNQAGAKDKQRFLWSSFYYIMNNWNTEGFNAYVVYPQLYGNFYDNVWCSKTSKNNLKNLIEHLIATEKIDPQRIVIAGSSLGAQGAQYMAHEMPEYISAHTQYHKKSKRQLLPFVSLVSA